MSQAQTIITNLALLTGLVQLTKEASDVILKIYHSDHFNLQKKGDESPVTAADLAAHHYIIAGLKRLTPKIPEVYMGNPVKIRDLALQMIELSGLVPEKDIPLQYIGLRPGEKLYEELLIDPAQSQPTRHPRIYSSEEPLPESEFLQKEIQLLSESISKRDLNSALVSMKRLVPEYKPDNGK